MGKRVRNSSREGGLRLREARREQKTEFRQPREPTITSEKDQPRKISFFHEENGKSWKSLEL
jgi:hypothetical protein